MPLFDAGERFSSDIFLPVGSRRVPQAVSNSLPHGEVRRLLSDLPLSDPGGLLSLRFLTPETHHQLSWLGCMYQGKRSGGLLFVNPGNCGCPVREVDAPHHLRCFVHRARTTSLLPHGASRSRTLGDELVTWKPRHPLLCLAREGASREITAGEAWRCW